MVFPGGEPTGVLGVVGQGRVMLRPEQLRPWPQATGLAVRDWMLARGMAMPEIVEGNLFVHADL